MIVKKIGVFLVVSMLVITSIGVITNNDDVIASTEGEENISLDLQMIYNITTYLSERITKSYDIEHGELAKGRVFGSKGEHDAAFYIASIMSDLGLYNLSLNPPYLERIQNTSKETNNTCELEVLARSMTIKNTSTNGWSNVDCYISPRWTLDAPFNRTVPHNKSKLTREFSYTNLKVHHAPRDLDHWLYKFLNDTIEDILNHFNETNITAYEDYIIHAFEDYYNFSFGDINEHPENATRLPWYNATLANLTDDYVLIREDTNNNPKFAPFPILTFPFPHIKKFLVRIYNWLVSHGWEEHGVRLDQNKVITFYNVYLLKSAINKVDIWVDRALFPRCKGVILYDYTNESHDMLLESTIALPILFINGSIGREINNSVSNYRVNFSLNQHWNVSEESYNVIGQINGTNPDPSKTIIINSLYDCWWDQGTADSAIGVGIMLALARKYKELSDNGIRPKQTLKFVAFGGEEYSMRGAYSYNATYTKENITTFIDLNQLGFTQTTPRLSFDIGTNKIFFKPLGTNKNLLMKQLLKQMGEDTNYIARTNNVSNFTVLYRPKGFMSDDIAFANMNKYRQKTNHTVTITFAKDTGWIRHHRDGANHTEGDSMIYYNYTDVAATASLIFNCSKYYCINPNCSFAGSVTYTTKDSPNDEDNLMDTVEADIPLQSILHSDLVRVKAVLKKHWWSLPAATVEKDYIINNSVTHHTMDITLPPYKDEGNYSVYLYLYNSTGRLNLITSFGLNDHPNATKHSDSTFHLHPRGNEPPAKPSKPVGPTTLRIGEKGTWSSTTSDPNHDLVGEKWYTKYSIIPPYIKFKDTGLYDPESTTPSVSHRFWIIGTHHLKVKAYDQFSGPLHPYNSSYSDVKDVTVKLCTNIDDAQQLPHQGNTLHMVQGVSKTLYGSQTGGQSVQWSWDDGHQHRYTQRNATYTFTNTGTYNITLNVTDSQTQITGTATVPVRVSVLDSDFNMSYFQGAAPDTPISFHNTSKAKIYNRITNCTWNFGDGAISYQSNVNHTFTQDGDYNVTLTVKDNQNNVDTDYCILHITSDPRLPEIPDVQSPEMITNASDATILAEVVATDRNLTNVAIQITTPNGTLGNYTMTNLVDDIYIFTLNNSSQNGQYNFTITATDSENNTNSTSGYYIITLPFLYYEPPTPADGASVNHPWVEVNVTVTNTCNTSAFIDWNRTLKGYWPMDTYNVTCIYDNSTYENLGWFHNGINASNITTGKYGKGLMFDGNDDYVDVGNDTSLNLGAGNFTFMVWEKSHATSYANTTVILSNQPESANMSGYVFGVKNTPFFYTMQNGQSTVLNGVHDVTDNTWHHLVYVRKGSNLSLYVDGAFDAGKTGTLRNITNNQSTCFSNENRTDWYHFDGVLDEAQLFGRALSREEINASYNNGLYRLYHNFTGLTEGTYSYYAHAIDTTGNMSETEVRTVTIDFDPQITAVSASPHTVGFGFNVTISANVTDSRTGVNTVNVNITYPDHTHGNYTMSHTTVNIYQYVFSSTWQTGQYNYTIWAADHSNNSNSSTGHHFHVSATATISIATLKDSYGKGEYINLTDPPASPENLSLVGRGLTWNAYYNASSGDNVLEAYQGPVNYQEDNGTWTPINRSLGQLATNHPAYSYGYRAGNDRGLYSVYFKPNLQNSWPVAFAYNRSADPTTHVVRSKLVGVGYLDPSMNWSYKYLQNVQSSQGQFSDNTATYENVFPGTDVTWRYRNTEMKEEITMDNTTKALLQNHPPSMYGLHNGSSYLVFITKLSYQGLNMYNASGMLTGNVTISDAGVDFKDALGYFKCALPLGEAYELNNESVQKKLTYRIVHLNGNTYLLSGLRVSDLTAMTFPVVIDPTLNLDVATSDGYCFYQDSKYDKAWSSNEGEISDTDNDIIIGQRNSTAESEEEQSTCSVYRGYLFFDTSALPSNAVITNATLSLHKASDYSSTDFDIVVQNGQPDSPHDPLEPGDYNKDLYDGKGGAFNTVNFTNGFNNIPLTDYSWLTAEGTTKFCLRSSRDIKGVEPTGNEYVSIHASEFLGFGCHSILEIMYSNQSKIKNTGSTDIKGYLLMQVQYREGEEWVVDHDTVNETTPRTINASEQLGLDTIFNGLVKTDDLTHGSGTYRVYAAFRDPEGNILKTSDEVELAAWYEFEVNL